jgi:arsenate reductase
MKSSRFPAKCIDLSPRSGENLPLMSKPRILILCTGNSCRSHMAEGILRAAAGDLVEVLSAGSDPSGYVHPVAITAMKEIGIDISGHHSKHMDSFAMSGIHTIVTVCGNANQACGTSPGQVVRHHWEFSDPAAATGTDEEILDAFRSARDQIRLVFEAYAAGMRDIGLGLSSTS